MPSPSGCGAGRAGNERGRENRPGDSWQMSRGTDRGRWGDSLSKFSRENRGLQECPQTVPHDRDRDREIDRDRDRAATICG